MYTCSKRRKFWFFYDLILVEVLVMSGTLLDLFAGDLGSVNVFSTFNFDAV